MDGKSSLLHRNMLGLLGMLLPFISIVGGLFVRDKVPQWWYSISVTYYITPALPIILGASAIFLMCYRSYEKIDTIVNVLSGVFALGVVVFPCSNPYGYENVGFFQLPVGVSNTVHIICAMFLFAFLAYNIGWLFTRGNNHKKNRIYKICAYGIIVLLIAFCVCQTLNSFLHFMPEWIVIIVETQLLFFFGFAWLVKGEWLLKNLE